MSDLTDPIQEALADETAGSQRVARLAVASLTAGLGQLEAQLRTAALHDAKGTVRELAKVVAVLDRLIPKEAPDGQRQ